jgi:wyosine [tRNA(Phe)-imidazoG37] synthetase (radical SAM superfamily)
LEAEPALFYRPEALLRETKVRIEKVGADKHAIDYISFVPDGEPTLDRNLGTLIHQLKRELPYPVAVITNGSLLWRDEVAAAVSLADWVSVKVDSVVEPVWRRLNRPDRRLDLQTVLQGIRTFAGAYPGELVSETMLVDRRNTGPEELTALAGFLAEISPAVAYISVPSRPPVKSNVHLPDSAQLDRALQAFADAGLKVRSLTASEGERFTVTADTVQDILSIAAVHPLREDALLRILERSNEDWRLVEQLLSEGRLDRKVHNRQTYFRTVL